MNNEGLFKPHLVRDTKACLLGEMAQSPATRDRSDLPEIPREQAVACRQVSFPRLCSSSLQYFMSLFVKTPEKGGPITHFFSMSQRCDEDSHVDTYPLFLQSHWRCQASPGWKMRSVVITDLKQRLGELEPSGCALGARQQ